MYSEEEGEGGTKKHINDEKIMMMRIVAMH